MDAAHSSSNKTREVRAVKVEATPPTASPVPTPSHAAVNISIDGKDFKEIGRKAVLEAFTSTLREAVAADPNLESPLHQVLSTLASSPAAENTSSAKVIASRQKHNDENRSLQR